MKLLFSFFVNCNILSNLKRVCLVRSEQIVNKLVIVHLETQCVMWILGCVPQVDVKLIGRVTIAKVRN